MEKALRTKLPGGKFAEVPRTHSRRMGAIRGHGNKTTEARLRAALVRAGVRGWRMQTRGITGRPDFYFPTQRVAVFLDGCFWHGCPRCGHVPSINRPFWKAKIDRNRQRDRENDRQLRATSVRVVRLWEHELKEDLAGCLLRVRALLGAAE